MEEGLFVATRSNGLIGVWGPGNQQAVGVHGHVRSLVNIRELLYMVSQI